MIISIIKSTLMNISFSYCYSSMAKALEDKWLTKILSILE